MQITVTRQPSVNGITFGTLTTDKGFSCVTLEPQIREVVGEDVSVWKVQNETAIPAGTYPVGIRLSPRFGQNMPHIEPVPGFEDVMIHWGNYVANTEGCLLVGLSIYNSEMITNSKATWAPLNEAIVNAINNGETVTIEYINP